MKTAISLPDQAAARFDRIAQKHGMTRSEFYRRAAEKFADELADADLTAQIDGAIAAVGQPGEESAELRRSANTHLVRHGRSAAARVPDLAIVPCDPLTAPPDEGTRTSRRGGHPTTTGAS